MRPAGAPNPPNSPGREPFAGAAQVRAKSVEWRETLRTNDKQPQTSVLVRVGFEPVTSTFAGA
jgi:hypothetical protein